jgi:F420 biosynthesis protein FbiB-like protein
LILPEEAHRFIRSRRSVRRFLPQAVPEDVLERILETATWAPSAHNRQPWRFILLAGEDSRRRLAHSMGADFQRDLLADGLSQEAVQAQVERSRQRILEAPLAILLCLDGSELDAYPDARRQEAETLMGVQSVAMAGQNLLLAAHAEGLAGVWICAPLFAQKTLREALSLPATWQPQGLVLMGYPVAPPQARPRKPVSEILKVL